ncbi:MAG TPA: DNA repair exonuclease [Fervidobacterium sp.]|nr:DNA repair exonuclease [Fervidobacterium sp.]HPT54591.1 DNA repair exonuclease [Fervidobacterium sp.]HPZ16787.1 DNA repair exonuclease [Fervidobacterium sp.]HQE47850.1 DNA repair exonuclease [Fervidobacterium sp.]HUM41444.1 DNA repair exonuclease [Fervidobacterium sp.]
MKILHTSDLHLQNVGDERWEALRTILNVCKSEKIDVLVISGDLFDTNQDGDNLRVKIRELFNGASFKTIILPGNHDAVMYSDGMYLGDDVQIITDPEKKIELDDVTFFGLPFKKEYSKNDKVAEVLTEVNKKTSKDKTNILIYHGDLLDSLFSKDDFGNEEGYMPITLADFEGTNFNYVLAGHFHRTFNVYDLPNGGYFVYPGSPVSTSVKETGKRSVNIFTVGEKPKSVPIDTFHYENINITFDPLSDEHPFEKIEKACERVDENTKVILNIDGYVDLEKFGITEGALNEKVNELLKGKIVEEYNRSKDVSKILEDDIFKRFAHKLNERVNDEDKRKRCIDLFIKAFSQAKTKVVRA